MAYVPSLREIPLTEDPHLAALEAISPSDQESPAPLDFSDEDAVAHVRICPQCREFLGLAKDFSTGDDDELSDGGVQR
jgi:hypothetical protein